MRNFSFLIVFITTACNLLIACAKQPLPKGQIVFSSVHPDNRSGDIFILDIESENLENLTNSPANDFYPVWSPDGKQIAFISQEPGNAAQIYIMNADGSDAKKILPDIYTTDIAWSPTGKQIAYGKGKDLCVITLITSQKECYSGNYIDVFPASWSPTGDKIAYQANMRTENGIFIMGSNGENQTQLTMNIEDQTDFLDTSPDWSPDGSEILFTRVTREEDDRGLYIIATDGGNLRHLFTRANFGVWSPDGEWIAFSRFINETQGADLFIAKPDGTNLIRVTRLGFVGYMDWRPTGIAYNPSKEEIANGIEQGDQIVSALARYFEDHHQYPLTLAEMVPGYLSAIPVTITGQEFEYDLLGEDYGKPYELVFNVATAKNVNCSYLMRLKNWDCSISFHH